VPDETQSRVVDAALDALYTSVGLAVLGVNRVQVARRDLAKRSGASTTDLLNGSDLTNRLVSAAQQLRADPQALRDTLSRFGQELQAIDDLIDEVGRRVGQIVDRVEPDLPDGVREVVAVTREAVGDLSAHYRAVLGLSPRPTA
jgi:ABC-type transporter Mla subunit MlaD